jgi:hypothetical protein
LTQGDLDLGGGPLPAGGPPGSEAVFVAELTSSGAHVVSRSFAGPRGRGLDIKASPGGDLWVTGVEDGVVDFGTGPLGAAGTNTFFAWLSPSGSTLAARTFGGGTDTNHNRVAVHPSGDAILAGDFVTSTDFGNGSLAGNPGHNSIYVARCVP